MKINLMTFAVITGLGIAALFPSCRQGGELIIQNEILSASYDRVAGSFSLTMNSSKLTAVSEGLLEGGAGKASVKNAEDQVFGTGRKIVINQEDGSTVTLKLYEGLSFMLVRKTLVNGPSEADIEKLVPVTFNIDLGVPSRNLMTQGTGGLLKPNENPGSYVFLACADPETRLGVVSGWITSDRGSGVVFSGIEGEKIGFKAQIDYGHLRLKAGQKESLETFAVGIFEDARLGLEEFAGVIQKQYDIKLKPRPAVYCTWYAEKHGGAADEASMNELADFVSARLKKHGLTVLQIDDQWQDGPAIDGPRRGFERPRPDGPYPNGFSSLASRMDKDDLTLGIWWMPFGRNHEDPAWKDRQDWFAKWADGHPMRTRVFGGTCLDLTHPGVKENISLISEKFRKEGIKYYKMDGVWTGTATQVTYINDGYKDDTMRNVAPFFDRYVTQIEAYRSGLKLIREKAGDDVFLSGCAISQNMRSFGPSFGLLDAMRIGPDFNHDGLGIKTGPIRASRYYFINGKIWWNDPDPAKVRTSDASSVADSSANGAVSTDVARLTSSFAAVTGQLFLLSDWLPNLPEERLEVLRRTMQSHYATARPVDYFDKFLPSVWLVTDSSSGVSRNVLGLFNWEKTTEFVGSSVERTGLNTEKTYYAFDFWNNMLLSDIKDSYSFSLPPESCSVIALREAEGHPVLLSTSAHVTQGMTDVVNEKWENNRLSGVSEMIAGDRYELRIRVPEGWKLAGAEAGLPVKITESDGLARISMMPYKEVEVEWSIDFEKK